MADLCRHSRQELH